MLTRLAVAIPTAVVQWRANGKPTTRDGRLVVRQVAYTEVGSVRERPDAVVPSRSMTTLATQEASCSDRR